MPTYEYQCKDCGNQFEQLQRYSDPPVTECPRCHGKVRRIIFPAGVIFKGSGWYITDSRKSPADDKPAKTGPDKSDAPTSESTPVASGDGAKTVDKAATSTTSASASTD